MAKKKTVDRSLGKLSIDAALEEINKRYGANSVILADKVISAVRLKKIPTGITALDIALGGGWPKGRVIEVFGPYSSFKSTVALKGIASFQRRYPEGLAGYIDLERTFDAGYAQSLGVDLKRLYICNPDSGEQAVDMLTDLVSLKTDLFFVVDSIAAMVPTAELEAKMDQQHMGLQARLVNRMMRVLVGRMKRDLYDTEAPSVTVIALNQTRQKIGVMFGNPETTPGGVGKDFAYSVILRLSTQHSKAITDSVEHNGVTRKVQYGQTIGFKVVKNKCGGPQHEAGEFVFYDRPWKGHAAYSFNNLETLFEYGCFTGVIKFIPGKGFSAYGIVGKTEKVFLAALRKKTTIQSVILRDTIAAIKNTSTFGETDDE